MNRFQRALATGNDVTMTSDVTATASDEPLTIPANANLELDLNGHTINRNRTSPEDNGYVIALQGKL